MQAHLPAIIVISVVSATCLVIMRIAARRRAARSGQSPDDDEAGSPFILVLIGLLTSLGLATLLLIGLSLWFVHSSIGGSDLCALAMAGIEGAAHQPVTIDHCAVDPISTRVVIDGVRIGPADRPMFAADRLAAGIDQEAILDGTVRIDGVEILRPRVQIDASKPGPPRRPGTRRRRGADCLPDLGNLELGHVAIVDGSLHVLLPQERGLALEGLGLSVDGDGDRLTLDLNARGATIADTEGATSVTRAVVSGNIDLTEGTARVQRLEISGPAGSLKAQGGLDSICLLDGHAAADLELDLGMLHNHLLRAIPNLAGTTSFHATTRFRGSNFDVKVDAKVKDSSIMDFEPGSFDVDARITPDRVTINRATVPLEDGTVSAHGTVELHAPFDLNADATFHGFSLGEVLERVGVAGLPVHLTGAGSATIAGPLMGLNGFDLSGSLKMSVNEFGVYNRSWRRRRAPGTTRFAGFTNGEIRSSFHLLPARIELEDTRVSTRSSDIDFDGSVHFNANKGLDLNVDAPRVSLGELGPFAGVNIQGQGRLKARLSGPYRGLDIVGDTALGDAKVLGYELGNVTGHIDLDLDRQTLTATDVEGEKEESTYAGVGRMSFVPGVPMEARIHLDSARVTDLMGIASPKIPSLVPLAQNVDATVTGDVQLSGPAAHPTIETQLSLAAARIYGQSFETGVVRARIDDAKELRVTRLHLQRDVAEIDGKASLRFADGHYTVVATSHQLHVADIDALIGRMPDLTGGIGFSLRGEGTLSEPAATARVKLHDWYRGDQPLLTTAVDLTLNGTTLTANAEVVSPWPLGTESPPQMPDEPLPRPPGSISESLRLTIQMHDDWPYALSGGFSVPDAAMVARPGVMKGITASVSGSVNMQGQLLHALATTSADLQLDRLAVEMRGISEALPEHEVAHAIFKGGVLTLEKVPLNGNFGMDAFGKWRLVNEKGELDLAGEKDMDLHGSLDLGVLRTLDPDIDRAEGRLDLQLGVHSKGKQALLANVNGTATLAGVSLHVKNLPIDLTDGAGTISCAIPIGRGRDGTIGIHDEKSDSGGWIKVEEATARLNDSGTMSLQGTVHVDERSIRESQLIMHLNKVPVPIAFADTRAIISGTPTLIRQKVVDETAGDSGHADVYENTLGGDLTIDQFKYTKDLDLDRALASAVDFSRRPPAAPMFEKQGEFLKLGLDVNCGDVRVENNLLPKSKLDCALRLTGTNLRRGLLGTISLSEGKAHVRNVDYTVSSGVINFIDRTGIRPKFDISADAQLSHEQVDYVIHVTAKGTPQDSHLELSSEPSLSQADILTLLTLGVLYSDLQKNGAGTALLGSFGDEALRTSGILQMLDQLLPHNPVFAAPTFHVTSDYIEQTGTVEPIGELELKLLNDNWKLSGQTSLQSAHGRKAAVDARLAKSVDADLQWDGDKPAAPSSGDFGSDVRWHWERP